MWLKFWEFILDLLKRLKPLPSEPGPATVTPLPPGPKPQRLLGIDVSHHNGKLEWAAIAAAGVEFAFIKASEGTGFVDPNFMRNVDLAQKAGIKVGAYHFFRPKLDGLEQARHFMKVTLGVPLDLSPVLDWEVADGVAAAECARQAKAWLNAVETHWGQAPIIYTGPSFFSTQMKSPAGFDRYPLWIAHYSTREPRIPAPWKTCTIWQFTETGTLQTVPGKKFDLNWADQNFLKTPLPKV